MKKALTIILTVIICMGVGFLAYAGLIWLLCWGLTKIGITSILGWQVHFSWTLVVVIAIISSLLKTTITINQK